MDQNNVVEVAEKAIRKVDPTTLRKTSDLCLLGGFLSIGFSILAWGVRRATANEGHAERLGIFIGLWAPTFFILSDRLDRYAERGQDKTQS